jgi:FixJ family two-component response regulator
MIRANQYQGTMDARPAKAHSAVLGRISAFMKYQESGMVDCPIVAVVDDDQSVRESLPDLLRELGLKALAFSSAREFLESDCIEKVGCLILDIAMPGMSGLELQKELEKDGHAVPIIFITAQRDENVRRRALEQGAVKFLYKPFSETALLEALNLALEKI